VQKSTIHKSSSGFVKWSIIGSIVTLLVQFFLLALTAWAIVTGKISITVIDIAVCAAWCISVFFGALLVCTQLESKLIPAAATVLIVCLSVSVAINILVFEGSFIGAIGSVLWGVIGAVCAFVFYGATKKTQRGRGKKGKVVKLNKYKRR
jgi:hypothetical protein